MYIKREKIYVKIKVKKTKREKVTDKRFEFAIFGSLIQVIECNSLVELNFSIGK